MTELILKWVLSSTALIAAVIVLRQVFGKRISARLRYGLWLAVLVRLLIPAPLYTVPAGTPLVLPETAVLNTFPTVRTPLETGNPKTFQPAESPVVPAAPSSGEETVSVAHRSVDLAEAAGGVWLAGSLTVLLVLLASNTGYGFRLRRARVRLAEEGPVPVYLLPGEGPAACLFGALRPAVYVSPDTAADSVMLRHVLTHEFTHYRHGDHLWPLLRCAALAVHWWNPLVWLAAELSRRDAELACDEGALKRLGDNERRAYGATLLALVTAKPGPGDLLRCATTMSGGKRSLRERIERIAHVRKRWLWAAVLTAALAVTVCACSFAKPADDTEAPPDGPLTQEELDVFNNEVFNGDGFNIRNQFLFLAADSPEEYSHIDLCQLFYNGTGKPMEVTEAERQAAIDTAWNGEDPGVDLIKCPAKEMDEVLRENLGLSLEETEKRGLDRFTYLPDYDAYYSFHGDTNYPGETTFLAGERKNGNILLYYQSGLMAQGGGWPVRMTDDGEMIPAEEYASACITLEEQPDGGYHFLSNTACETPLAMSVVYPDWDPERTVSLDSAAPWRTEPVPVERFSGQVTDFLKVGLFNLPYVAEFWRGADGYTYGSVQPGYSDSSPRDYFLRFEYDASDEQISVVRYTNVCGFSGFMVRYPIAMGTYLTDYYYFDEDNNLHRLVSDSGLFVEFDLDGDGQKELIWSPVGYGNEYLYLLYQRDGQLYRAELKSLIRSAWPEAGYIDGYAFGNGNQRCINLSVEVPVPNADFTVAAYRSVYFDGENLRIYRDETPYTDHIKDSLEAPLIVKSSARRFVENQLKALNEEGFGIASDGAVRTGVMVWDDWRIIGLRGPYYETVEGEQIEIWNVSYETHTPTPELVVLAGGSYLSEDGWAMIGYPGCDYLCFREDEDGYRSLMFAMMENDCAPGSEMFQEDLARQMKELNFIRTEGLSCIAHPPEELTRQELHAFNYYFGGRDMDKLHNGLLRTTYGSWQEIGPNLNIILYDMGEPVTDAAEQQEAAKLLGVADGEEWRYARFTPQRLRDCLTANFQIPENHDPLNLGVSMEEVLGPYSEKYDAYYITQGMDLSTSARFTSGERMENGTVRLYYDAGILYYMEDGEVSWNLEKQSMCAALAPDGTGGWRMISNRAVTLSI